MHPKTTPFLAGPLQEPAAFQLQSWSPSSGGGDSQRPPLPQTPAEPVGRCPKPGSSSWEHAALPEEEEGWS